VKLLTHGNIFDKSGEREMSVNIEGRVWRFGKDIDTDELFAGRFIMVGDERNPEAYKRSILKGAFESLSTIGKENQNIPHGFIEAVSRVVSGYEKNVQEDQMALKGHIIVAGENFGIGSSRQQAAEALRFFGIVACLAETIHRIFFRNFWNLNGIAIDQKGISSIFETGDIARVDLQQYVAHNLTNKKESKLGIKLPPEFIAMYEAGGLIPYHRKRTHKLL
jgi:3-isopropylmalate/(R)-2-methylmalate dehydratase small subunit